MILTFKVFLTFEFLVGTLVGCALGGLATAGVVDAVVDDVVTGVVPSPTTDVGIVIATDVGGCCCCAF